MELTRRGLLAGAGLLGLGGARIALAGPGWTGDTVVVLFQRGGADWLSLVPPIGDPAYASLRPTIAVPATTAVQLDDTFALHPGLAALKPLWDSGNLAVVHAVGSPDPSRSHFEAQRSQELGAGGGLSRTGWADRLLSGLPGRSPLDAVHVGSTRPPTSEDGPEPVVAVGRIADLALRVPRGTTYAHRSAVLQSLWSGLPGVGPAAAASTFTALRQVGSAAGLPAAGYPTGPLAASLSDVARLVKSGLGVQVATVDVGGWDMHTNLGKAGTGQMATRATDLARSIAAFAADLGPRLAQVTLVTVTEFGRRAAENGNAGLDHGHGFATLVVGGAVAGGRVYGSWPTLAPAALDRGDLAATTDHRQVLAEVLDRRLGGSVGAVFPGLAYAPLGVVRGR